MLIEQIIEFELRVLPGCTSTSKTGYFYDKTKISQHIFSSEISLKVLHEAMYPAFPYLGQVTYRI